MNLEFLLLFLATKTIDYLDYSMNIVLKFFPVPFLLSITSFSYWKLENIFFLTLKYWQVDVGRLKDIREDVNDYIENSQEPDFVENEYIYDDIEGLEDMLLDVSNKNFFISYD